MSDELELSEALARLRDGGEEAVAALVTAGNDKPSPRIAITAIVEINLFRYFVVCAMVPPGELFLLNDCCLSLRRLCRVHSAVAPKRVWWWA